MSTITKFAVVFWALLWVAPAPASDFVDRRCESGRDFCWVPMEALLAVPDRFDGKVVRITGIAGLHGKGYIKIYASREAADIEDSPSAVIVDLSEVARAVDPLAIDGKPVTVRGTFEFLGNTVHEEALGTIVGVKAVQVRLNREEMRKLDPTPSSSKK